MRHLTEFIILYEDRPLPEVELFCPSFWSADDFDVSGDYYADEIDGRWTQLEITRRQPGRPVSTVEVYTQRERNVIEPTILDAIDLQRFIDYRQQGRYAHEAPGLASIVNLAVTMLRFDTTDDGDYAEFLETTDGFLRHTKGYLVNYTMLLDEARFRAEFIEAG